MAQQNSRPVLFILSGPSGAGKGTAMRLVQTLGVERIPTYTTRPPRPSEVDGLDYHFVTSEEFDDLRRGGQLVEYTRTYSDHWYGAPVALVTIGDPGPAAVELEPNGFHRVRTQSHRRVVGLFVMAASEEHAIERILERNEEDNLLRRQAVMSHQIPQAWAYDYVVVNNDVAEFREVIAAIIYAELARWRGATWLVRSWAQHDSTIRGVT